jgi:DNA-binding NarL/FixJ family response regulator
MHGGTATHRVGFDDGAFTSRDDRAFTRLTSRQLEVLALMAEGRSNAAIAQSLIISERAVVQHTSQIYERLDILPDDGDHRRVLAVVRYLSYATAA